MVFWHGGPVNPLSTEGSSCLQIQPNSITISIGRVIVAKLNKAWQLQHFPILYSHSASLHAPDSSALRFNLLPITSLVRPLAGKLQKVEHLCCCPKLTFSRGCWTLGRKPRELFFPCCFSLTTGRTFSHLFPTV